MKRKDLKIGMLVATGNRHDGAVGRTYANPAMIVSFGWTMTSAGRIWPIGVGVAVAVREERIQNGRRVFFWHPRIMMLHEILAPWNSYQDAALAGAINKVRLSGEEA